MPLYRLAKAAEHAVNIEWMRGKLQAFRADPTCPGHILSRLDQEFQKAEQALGLLNLAASISGLEDDADSLSKNLDGYFQITAVHYVAGLERQTALEAELRQVLLNACGRLSLNWIQDMLVRLSDHLAIYPIYRQGLDMPVFYGPPNLLESFLSLAGIYHELGHSVFLVDKEFLIQLTVEVKTYFDDEKAKLGPMTPELHARMVADIDDAARYWDDLRLAEIFCDLFGSYVCGPANVISVMDLAMARGLPPTELISDYPPNAVRVWACHHILSVVQKTQPLLEEAFADWEAYESKFAVTPNYGKYCPPVLVQRLADKTADLIINRLGTPRYGNLLPSLADARAVQAGINLEDLLNAGAVVLLEAPSEFDAWRRATRPLVA